MEVMSEISPITGKNKMLTGGTQGPPLPVLAKRNDKPIMAATSTTPKIIPVKVGACFILKALIIRLLISLLYKPLRYPPHRALNKS